MAIFFPLHPYLAAQIGAKQISHAYLFSGNDTAALAQAFAAALLCPEAVDTGTACGVCAVCVNIIAGTYADCRRIAPEGAQHKVLSMRELVAQAHLSPIHGGRKVFIIEQADKFNDESANTLLKVLEEPPLNTVLILLAELPDAILPTILSRCQQFVFAGSAGEPWVSPEALHAAEELLLSLPEMPVYQVLLKAEEYEKDREGQKQFFFALLKCLHKAVRGESALPFMNESALRSANMLESSIDLLGKNVNQKLLTDIVYLRLWQNCQG